MNKIIRQAEHIYFEKGQHPVDFIRDAVAYFNARPEHLNEYYSYEKLLMDFAVIVCTEKPNLIAIPT